MIPPPLYVTDSDEFNKEVTNEIFLELIPQIYNELKESQELIGNNGRVFLINNNKIFADAENSEEMFPDTVHPNGDGQLKIGDGQLKIANNIFDYIKSSQFEFSPRLNKAFGFKGTDFTIDSELG
mgnify:CR=1 FL=1